MNLFRFLTCAALMPLAACSGGDTTDPSGETATASASPLAGNPTSMPSGPAGGTEYVAAAGASDAYEIESSRMALDKSQNDAVREFAQMMIDHHTATTKSVAEAAQASGFTPPPPQPTPMQQQMLEQLSQLTGEEFDDAYTMQQREAHQMALQLHQGYAENGDTAALRQTAAAAVPIIERHIAQLQDL